MRGYQGTHQVEMLYLPQHEPEPTTGMARHLPSLWHSCTVGMNGEAHAVATTISKTTPTQAIIHSLLQAKLSTLPSNVIFVAGSQQRTSSWLRCDDTAMVDYSGGDAARVARAHTRARGRRLLQGDADGCEGLLRRPITDAATGFMMIQRRVSL